MILGRPHAVFLATGAVLLACFGFLVPLSSRFEAGISLAAQPIILMTATMLLAGIAYLSLWLGTAKKPTTSRTLFTFAILLGLALRLMAMSGSPILENDFNRYLWDGAVLLEGKNPYLQAPIAAKEDPELASLAKLSGDLHRNINHPHLRTIYPFGATLLFAAVQWMTPWELGGLKVILLLADLATLILLLALLTALKKPSLWVVFYWWNPLAIQQSFNAVHMDALLMPVVLASLLFAIKNRHITACWLIGVAATIKIWPLLVFPLLGRPLLNQSGRLFAAFFGALAIAATGIAPLILPGLSDNSGLGAYATSWAANDAFHQALVWALNIALPATEGASNSTSAPARIIITLLIAALALWQARNTTKDPEELCRRAFFLVTALFLLFPAQFPWYALWFAPFLALIPNFALGLLMALLSLYFLRFHFAARGQSDFFDHGIVWFEFLPVWLLLAWQARPKLLPFIRRLAT